MSTIRRVRRRSRLATATVVTAGAVGLVAVVGLAAAIQGDGQPSFLRPTAESPPVVSPDPEATALADPPTLAGQSALGSAVAAPRPAEPEAAPDAAEAEGANGAGGGEADAAGGGADAADGAGGGGAGAGGGGSGAGSAGGASGGGPAEAGEAAGPPRVAPGNFPDADSTGPTSTNLRPYGDLRADEPGAVYEGLELGCVDVYADGVTIRDSVIRCGRDTYPVYNRAAGLRLVDVEIDGQGQASNCVAHSRYELIRAELYGCKDGARANGDVLIQDSYIHSLVRVPGGHHDVVQSTKGSNITLRGNTLIAETNGRNMNAAYMAGSAQGPLDRVYFIGNYVVGGNFTLQIDPGIRDGSYRDNVFGRGAQFGPVRSVPDSIEWENNTWEDTGALIPR